MAIKSPINITIAMIIAFSILMMSASLAKHNNTTLTLSNASTVQPIAWRNYFPGGWASGYWPAWNEWGWTGWRGNWVTGDPY